MKMVIIIISSLITSMLWQVNSQTTTTGSSTLIIPIPDESPIGATHLVDIGTIPIGSEITNIELDLAIDHTYLGDLKITITSPGLEVIWLMIRPGRDDLNNTGLGHGANLDAAFPITFKDTSVNPAEDMGSMLLTGETVCDVDSICDYLAGSDITTETLADLANSINTNGSNPNGVWKVWIGDFAVSDTGIFFVPELRVTYNLPLGIEDNQINDKITLFPNPASDHIYIGTDEIISGIEIYNILGQKVFQYNIPIDGTDNIDVSNLSTGTYITKLTSETGTETLKFIKN